MNNQPKLSLDTVKRMEEYINLPVSVQNCLDNIQKLHTDLKNVKHTFTKDILVRELSMWESKLKIEKRNASVRRELEKMILIEGIMVR